MTTINPLLANLAGNYLKAVKASVNASAAGSSTTTGSSPSGDSLSVSQAALQALEAALAAEAGVDGTTGTGTGIPSTTATQDPVQAAQAAFQRMQQAFLQGNDRNSSDSSDDSLTGLMDQYVQGIATKNAGLVQAALERVKQAGA